MMVEYCAFCRLARNEIPAAYVYGDEETLAFLDTRPVSEGHTLVIPRKHYENIYDIPDDEVAYLFRIVRKMAFAVKTAVAADGIRIVQNNGSAAGQAVFHFHVHIIPAYEGQEMHQHRKVHEAAELDDVAKKIRLSLENRP